MTLPHLFANKSLIFKLSPVTALNKMLKGNDTQGSTLSPLHNESLSNVFLISLRRRLNRSSVTSCCEIWGKNEVGGWGVVEGRKYILCLKINYTRCAWADGMNTFMKSSSYHCKKITVKEHSKLLATFCIAVSDSKTAM